MMNYEVIKPETTSVTPPIRVTQQVDKCVVLFNVFLYFNEVQECLLDR